MNTEELIRTVLIEGGIILLIVYSMGKIMIWGIDSFVDAVEKRKRKRKKTK